MLNVCGHRLGTAEIESALVLHDLVAEAAVVGFPHPIKGQGIYAYVTLNVGIEGSSSLKGELKDLVREEISAIALPDLIQWAPSCLKPAPVKSCAEFCVRLPPTNFTTWAIPRLWPIRRWSNN